MHSRALALVLMTSGDDLYLYYMHFFLFFQNLKILYFLDRVLRLAGYRQFTWWIHTRLGKSVRLVIPSCAVWGIRDAYPDPSNTYTGFKDVEEEQDSDFPC